MEKSPRWHMWLIPCSLLLLASGEVQAATGPTVTSVVLKPSKISGGSGDTSAGTVTLSAPAPVGGTLVALSSSNPALAAVGPSVTVPAGQSSATFTVWTNAGYRRYSGLSFAPVISASANGSAQSATLTVTAQRLPADIQNDTADRHGTVCGGSFPATSGDKGILYTCFAGPNIGTAGTCTFNQECLVAGCINQPSVNFLFSDQCGSGAPYPISDNPSVVVGASSASGTATSFQPAPKGGGTAKITSGFSCVTVPFSVTIPENMTSASFTISNTDTSVGHFAFLDAAIAAGDVFTPPDQLGRGWYVVLPSGTCKPDTCAAHGYNCGVFSDGCGGTIDCGACSSPNSCGGAGTVGVCGCTPMTCASQGFSCGSVPDGCGGTLNCGTCPSGQVCNIYNQCGAPCTPSTCAQVGANCGQTGDGCGGIIDCGTCPAGQTCNSIICVPSCTPATCQSLGYNCGTAYDGCGGTLNCGNCSHHQSCNHNVCGGY